MRGRSDDVSAEALAKSGENVEWTVESGKERVEFPDEDRGTLALVK